MECQNNLVINLFTKILGINAFQRIVLSTGENTGRTGLNGKLFGKIVFWWLITVPVAFGASYLLELLILAA